MNLPENYHHNLNDDDNDDDDNIDNKDDDKDDDESPSTIVHPEPSESSGSSLVPSRNKT